MKKVLFSMLLAVGLSGAAVAQANPYYGGLGLGVSDTGFGTAHAARSVAVDNNDTSFSAFVGKKLGRGYGVEAGFTRLGDYYAKTAKSGFLMQSQLVSIAGVAQLPLTHGVKANVKLGLAHTEVTMRGDTAQKIKPYMALGAEYALGPKVAAFVEYQRIEDFAGQSVAADNVQVGLKTTF